MTHEVAGHDAVDRLYWRDEILQALYWMRGEGLADQVDPARLARFLVVEPGTLTREMERLSAEGYLEATSSSSPVYRLSPLGLEEGARSFRDEFAELTHRGHLQCSDDCWCNDPDRNDEPCPTDGRVRRHSGASVLGHG